MCCNLFQQEIHKKIMSLNFRDCHAKIRQVDSQATVGNAVVVQVNISKTQQHQHDDFLTQKTKENMSVDHIHLVSFNILLVL